MNYKYTYHSKDYDQHVKMYKLENKVMDLEKKNREFKNTISELYQKEKYLVNDLAKLISKLPLSEKEEFILAGHIPVGGKILADADYYISLMKTDHIICFVSDRIKTMIHYEYAKIMDCFRVYSIHFKSPGVIWHEKDLKDVFMPNNSSKQKFNNPEFLLTDGDRIKVYKNERNLLEKMRRFIFGVE